jgi:hypothetical protein
MRLLTIPAVMIRVPVEVAKGAFGVAKGAYGFVAGGDEPAPPEREPDFASRARPAERRSEAGNGRRREPPVVDQSPPEPPHVDEEPELVAEVAEEGAEDGAGAEVTVEEPWPGYDEMSAADIQDRLVAEDEEAVVAAVRLYEASRKGRAAVLEATSRHMSGG